MSEALHSLEEIDTGIPSSSTQDDRETLTTRALAHWYQKRVEEAVRINGLVTHEVYISKELAQIILAKNHENRRLKASVVKKYAYALQQGQWHFNGETIKIDIDGNLNDGQHRLQAVIETGIPLRTLIVFGLSRQSRYTVDQGAARSVGDVLAMSGVAYQNEAAGVARFLYFFQGRTFRPDLPSPSRADVHRIYQDNAEEIDSAVKFVLDRRMGRIPTGNSVAAAALLMLRRENPQKADEYMDKFLTGTELSSGDPILQFRNRAISLGVHGRYSRFALLKLHLKTYDAWIEGKPLKRAPFLKYPDLRRAGRGGRS